MGRELHLYDPATNTHYSNGGFIPENSPVPLEGGEWAEGKAPADAPFYAPPDPLSVVTNAVLGLPVGKRTEPAWGAFISRCLMAIQHADMESLGHLIGVANGTVSPLNPDDYVTADSDYLAILGQAKTLFGV